MKSFAALFNRLESSNSTNKKIQFLFEYFRDAPDDDKLWVIALFSHKRPRRTVKTSLLRQWAAEMAEIPLWLFEETYHIVGDLAETIAKVVPGGETRENKSLSAWIELIIDLKDKTEDEKKSFIIEAWSVLDETERFLLNKLITGGFRMGVSQKTIVKALARLLEEEEAIVAHKLMGDWTPLKTNFKRLLLESHASDALSRPYPFYLAFALEDEVEELGSSDEWMAEYKWDGIRGQLIKRGDNLFLWSRGEELINEQFPEFEALLSMDEDFVIDGEILIVKDGEIQDFNKLQKRLGRKNPSKKLLSSHPAMMMVYDIMELGTEDLRDLNQLERRGKLEFLMKMIPDEIALGISENIEFDSWEALKDIRSSARNRSAEGLMLKRKSGSYKVGRKKGDWFKWKLDPLCIDAVMIYAQRGHGRRANLYTDFTFALRDGEKLVPVAKAYSGLTDDEFREISRFVRRNTLERFGPVCSVPPVHVFEIAFEAVAESTRHKSGVALRFPRILRWRKDKQVRDIDNLEQLKSMIKGI